MSDLEPKSTSPASEMSTLTDTSEMLFNFIKSLNFRAVHASGAWFGGDAEGNIHLTFFNERTPIPQEVVLVLNKKGEVVGENESKRKSREGMIREMEVDVILSVQAASHLHRLLGQNLENFKELVAESK